MKIAIQGHPTRGKEIIQILENLGGKNTMKLEGTFDSFYYIDDKKEIVDEYKKNFPSTYKLYTIEEFEKEFPFKVGDKVKDCSNDEIGVITDLTFIDNMLIYNVDFVNSGRAFMPTEQLKSHKEMKEERNITLTLEKAKEWYKKGGELKEIALQAFSEKELNPRPRSWEEFSYKYKVSDMRYAMPFKYAALWKLEQLRNCWWGDWKPEWNASHKYAIKNLQGEIAILGCSNVAAFLVFPTREMAKEFFECFRDLIEKAGDLI